MSRGKTNGAIAFVSSQLVFLSVRIHVGYPCICSLSPYPHSYSNAGNTCSQILQTPPSVHPPPLPACTSQPTHPPYPETDSHTVTRPSLCSTCSTGFDDCHVRPKYLMKVCRIVPTRCSLSSLHLLCVSPAAIGCWPILLSSCCRWEVIMRCGGVDRSWGAGWGTCAGEFPAPGTRCTIIVDALYYSGCTIGHADNNSMKFHPTPPPSNNLADLTRVLFKQHCIISIPAIVLLFSGFLIISITMPSPHHPGPPNFLLPSMLHLYFQHTVDYLEYFCGFATQLLELGYTNGSLSESVGRYGGIETGLLCLVGEAAECDRFVGLAGVAWQYKTNPYLNSIISQVIICNKANLTCVANCLKKLQPHQLALINNNRQLTNQSPFLTLNNNTPYLITQNSQLLILAKLHKINHTISQIITKIQTSSIQYYKLSIVYPYQQLVHEYNPSQLSVQALSLQEHDISIYFRNGLPALKFMLYTSPIQESFQYLTQFSFFASLIFLLFLVRTQRNSIKLWVETNFSRIELLNKLYQYTIRDIFTGVKPSISNILQRGPTAQLFQTLSQLVDKSIVQIEQEEKTTINKGGFKFQSAINDIIEKYKGLVKGNMEAKNKYILANRFNLQTYINDLCESEAKTLKDYYLRAQELGILPDFFKFAYLSILKSRDEFIYFLQQDQTALPSKLLEYFIKINQNIHQADTIYDKLGIFREQEEEPNEACLHNPATSSNIEEESYEEENKKQLQFRVRVYIIPKYLTMLKELDSKNNYAEELGLDRQLRSLAEIVDNTRYLLAKHNKSIRNYCK